MKKSRFNEEQVIGILREGQSGMTVKAACAKHNVSEQTYYGWKRRYGGMEVSELRKAKALEEECGRLRRLVADLSIQNQILKEEPERSEDSLPQVARRAAHEVAWQNAKKW